MSLKASSSVFPWVARSNSGQETTNPSPEGSIIAVSFFSDIFEMIGILYSPYKSIIFFYTKKWNRYERYFIKFVMRGCKDLSDD